MTKDKTTSIEGIPGAFFGMLMIGLLFHGVQLFLIGISSDGCTKCLLNAGEERWSMIWATCAIFAIRIALDVALALGCAWSSSIKFQELKTLKWQLPFVFYVLSTAAWWAIFTSTCMSCGKDCDPPMEGTEYFRLIGNVAPLLSIAALVSLDLFVKSIFWQRVAKSIG
jgi:hypothetical protein